MYSGLTGEVISVSCDLSGLTGEVIARPTQGLQARQGLGIPARSVSAFRRGKTLHKGVYPSETQGHLAYADGRNNINSSLWSELIVFLI